MEYLLQSSTCDMSKLEEVCMKDCVITAPISTEFLDCLTEKLAGSVPLRKLEFSCKKLDKLDADSLSQVWTSRYGDTAKIVFDGDSVMMSVANR